MSRTSVRVRGAVLLLVVVGVIVALATPVVRAAKIFHFAVVQEPPGVVHVGDTVTFTAWSCLYEQGTQPFGEDGVPGTRDDDCKKVVAKWTQEGDDVGKLRRADGGRSAILEAKTEGSFGVNANHKGLISGVFSQVVGADVQPPGGGTDSGPGPAVGVAFVTWPPFFQIVVGETIEISFWLCPADADGRPIMRQRGRPWDVPPDAQVASAALTGAGTGEPPTACEPTEATVETTGPFELSATTGERVNVTATDVGQGGVFASTGEGSEKVVGGSSGESNTGGFLFFVDEWGERTSHLPLLDESPEFARDLAVSVATSAASGDWPRGVPPWISQVAARLRPGSERGIIPVVVSSKAFLDSRQEIDQAKVTLTGEEGRLLSKEFVVFVTPATRGTGAEALPDQLGNVIFLDGEAGAGADAIDTDLEPAFGRVMPLQVSLPSDDD